MIKDYDFYNNICDDLKPDYLDSGQAQIKLLKLINSTYGSLRKPLTIDIIRASIEKARVHNIISDPQAAGINEAIDFGLSLTASEIDYVKKEAYEFLKRQVIAIAVGESIGHLEANRLDTVYSTIIDASRKTFGLGESLGYNYKSECIEARYSEPPRSGVWSTGYPKLDSYLDGGFAKQECYTVLSPSGRGKTAWLCNLSVAAQIAGLNTLFVSLEMTEKQICMRHDSILSGFSSTELSTNKEYRKLLSGALQSLKGSFYVKGFNRGALTSNGLHNFIERYSNEVCPPDVIILDWLGAMALPNTGRDGKRHEQLAAVADDFINMTREFSFSGLSAHQTNRSAVSKDQFDYASISESFASIFGMDVVLGLGASNESKDAGKRTISLLENRFGPDSVSVKLIGDLPGQPLTFKFREVETDSEEESLLSNP